MVLRLEFTLSVKVCFEPSIYKLAIYMLWINFCLVGDFMDGLK